MKGLAGMFGGGKPQQDQSGGMEGMLPGLLESMIFGEGFGMPQPQQQMAGGAPQEMYQYMMSKGIPHNHALGMLSNIKAESNYKQDAVGDNGNAYGIFQHNGPRKDSLFKAVGTNTPNWQQQIDYAMTEPESHEYLKTPFNNPQDASSWFTTKWERPSNAQSKARQRLAYIPKF